jgi:peptide/nickel transport system permease protein
MGRYILKRVFAMGWVLFAVSIFTFFLIHMAPGDPRIMMAMSRFGNDVTPEQIEWIGKEMGLSAPIHVQYGIWLEHLLSGDLGNSIRSDQSVISELATRLPATLKLGLSGFFLSLLIALPMGIAAAVKQNSIFDHVVMMGSIVLISIPGFWLALLLILLFSVKWGLLPVCGQGSPAHMVLPVTVLALGMAATTTRLTRTCMLEVLQQDYILAARGRGLPEKRVIRRHALKNALIPIATYSGIKLARTFQVAVIVETVFAWEGIGKLMVDSCFARDFPMIQGCVLLVGAVFVLANFCVDLSYLALNPRIRLMGEAPLAVGA